MTHAVIGHVMCFELSASLCAYLLKALHAHAQSVHSQGLVQQQPLHIKCAWVSFKGDLSSWAYAILLLQGLQDKLQQVGRYQ